MGNAKDEGKIVLIFLPAICREDNFRFVKVDSLSRVRAEMKEDSVDGVAVLRISLGKKCEIISKEKIGYGRPLFRDGNRGPEENVHFIVNFS